LVFWFDQRLLEVLAARRVSAIDRFAEAANSLDHRGNAMLIVAVIVGITLVARREWLAMLTVSLSVLVADIVASGLKDLIAEPRPPRELMMAPAFGWSMPSSHAAYSAAAAVALVLSVEWASPAWRRLTAGLLAAAAASVGFLMVYAGVHWLSDVVVGWVLGGAVGLGVNAAMQLVATRRTALVEQ
jgi:membrane-associated phospholipid phosphatase